MLWHIGGTTNRGTDNGVGRSRDCMLRRRIEGGGSSYVSGDLDSLRHLLPPEEEDERTDEYRHQC